MMYIDLFCDKSQLEEWRAWCKDNDVEEGEPECRTGYITRGSGVMDYYFRLLCIAAYRRTKSSTKVVCMTSNKPPPYFLLTTSEAQESTKRL